MGENKRLLLRSKEIRLAFLDQALINDQKSEIQTEMFAFPIALLALIGLFCAVLRKRAYRQ